PETAEQWNARVSECVHARFAEQLQDNLTRAVKCANLRPLLRQDRLQRASYLALPSHLSSFCFNLPAGSLRLAIEEGRMKKVKREERLCPLCRTEVEDAAHFALRCSALDRERRDLLQKLSESSTKLPSWTGSLLGLRPSDGEETPEGAIQQQRVL